MILISDCAIECPSDPLALHLIAHEYAHHVQNLTGIGSAAHTKALSLVRSRRLELQADCLGAAFMGSIWASREYRDEDWKDVVDIYRRSGDEKVNKERSHGTGKNRVAWIQKGFAAASRAACNTWTAPVSRIA